MTQRRNLVFITVDAWRADYVDAYAGRPLVPALDAVAGHTVRFDRVYATAPWTTPALVSVFTGVSPAVHRVHHDWSSPPPDRPAVVKALRGAGWHAPNLCYLNRLDNYAHLGYRRDEAPEAPTGADDDTLVEALQRTPEPYFLWYHYKFVHLPYWAPARYRRAMDLAEGDIPARVRDSVGTGFVVPRDQFRLEPEDQDVVRRLYAAGLLQMNDWLTRVLETVTGGAAADRTTVVLSSDHGEELLEHGHVGHASTAHHATLFEEVLRIPLLIIDPRVSGSRTVGARSHGADLFATLQGLAGLEPRAVGDGVDLTPAILGDQAAVSALEEIANRRMFYFHSARMGCPTPRTHAGQFVEGISDGVHKLVRERFDRDSSALYDLENDPAEQVPLQKPELLATWAERLRRLAGVKE